MGEVIPDKLYFRIGEVAEITSLRPSVLRFWETEFTALRPPKSGTGQRIYSRNDLELVLEIKRLLYTERLTIDGARKKLTARRSRSKEVEPDSCQVERGLIEEITAELKQIHDSL
jgi:DNA-binding transcriptional MerR regulator